MIENVKQYVEHFCTIDEPVPYKELSIYPVKVRQYPDFATCYGILTIDKNATPDVSVIQMSYLDFLLNVICKNETVLNGTSGITVGNFQEQRLSFLLQICFNAKPDELQVKKNEKGRNTLVIQGVEINSSEFDEISKIISFQNITDYYDEYIDPEMKKSIEEYYALKNKDLTMPTLEQKIAVVILLTGLSKQQILDMTYREFDSVFHYGIAKQEYELMRGGEFSGAEFDKPVKHWVFAPKENKYQEAFASYEGLKNKIEQL